MTRTVVQWLIDAATLGSLYAAYALGISLLFGVMRLINLAYGEIVMIAAFAILFVDGVIAMMAVAIVAAIVVAVLQDWLVFRRLRNAGPATLLVTSFALSFALANTTRIVMGPHVRSADLSPVLRQTFTVGGLRVPAASIFIIVLTALILGAVVLFLKKTRIGVQMRAAAENFQMAQMLGVRSNVVIAAAFAISGAIAGLTTLMVVGQAGQVTYTMGLPIVLFGFIAAVAGGLGSLPGAVAGGYIIGAVSMTLQYVLPLEIRAARDAFVFGAVFLLMIVRPQGLFGVKYRAARV